MEENRRKRPEKKPENPVREWISDNLRYIMLFGGIALAVVIIAVAVNMFAGPGDADEDSQQSSAGSSVTSETSSSSEGDSSADSGDGTDADSSTDSESEADADPSVSESAEPAEEGSVQEASPALSDADADVAGVVTAYMNALVSGDADAAAAVLENITDEDRAAIAQGVYADSYDNFTVYSYPGDTDGSYVAFVRYEYTYPGYGTPVPALTQFYVFTRDDGNLCIASEATQQSKADYMNSLLEREDVAQLVSEVQSAYDAALASDPALAEYINSISQ